MILQALVRHYDQLAMKGKLDRPGWQSVKVSFAIRIDEYGRVRAIQDIRQEVTNGKKKTLAAQLLNLPEQEKRTVGIAPNFLCDNVAYILGIDSKGKPERAKQCFEACAQRHHALLDGVNEPFAEAILRFFDNWDPLHAAEHELVQPILKELATANLIFQMGSVYAQEVPEIVSVWQKNYETVSDDAVLQQCLVTGEMTEIQRLHPTIKGVQDAQAVGASLVSFNAPAFESYAHDGGQGMNAPVGKRAAFAYGAALNLLLADRRHMMHLGDATIVFWAEDAEDAYADFFADMLGIGNTVVEDDLLSAMQKIAMGLEIRRDAIPLNPRNQFYILGLAPNSARLSVRFFLQDTFGAFTKHLAEHQERLRVVKPAYEKWETLSIYEMLKETVNPNSTNKNASPQMAGDVMRAILLGGRYPETLYSQTQLRIRAEHDVNRGKAAIIKAYLIRNRLSGEKQNIISEVAQVELNENTTYAPYVLGRLFAVLEGLQQTANPGINTTIRDRYFNSACCTPSIVFPVLMRLSNAHLNKLESGLAVYMEKQIEDLTGMMNESYPKRLNLKDQGVFQLGYYHQKQKRYQKKGEQSND